MEKKEYTLEDGSTGEVMELLHFIHRAGLGS